MDNIVRELRGGSHSSSYSSSSQSSGSRNRRIRGGDTYSGTGGRSDGDAFDLFFTLTTTVVYILIGLIFCYNKCYKNTICKKQWDNAEKRAQLAVANAETVVVNIEQNKTKRQSNQQEECPANTTPDYDDKKLVETCKPSLSGQQVTIENNGGSSKNNSTNGHQAANLSTSGQKNLEEDPKPLSVPLPLNTIPVSGEYDIGYLIESSSFPSSGKHKWSELNLRFVSGSGAGALYGIFGHGLHRNGFYCRPADSQILNGFYNATTGLAWWTELVDYQKAYKENRENQFGEDPRSPIVSHITMLSHGKFDFDKMTFEGWYYAQLRRYNEYHEEERGSYRLFKLKTDHKGNIV